MLFNKFLCIIYHQSQVSTTSCTRHLPSKDIVQSTIMSYDIGNVSVILFGMYDVSKSNCYAKRVTILRLTYPVPATAIFIFFCFYSFQYLQIAICKLYYHDGCYALHTHHDLFLAFSTDLDKGSFYPIEFTTHNLYRSPLIQMNFFG